MNYLQSNNILQIILSRTVVGIISINVSKPINIDTALISIINVKIIEKKTTIFFNSCYCGHNTIYSNKLLNNKFILQMKSDYSDNKIKKLQQ